MPTSLVDGGTRQAPRTFSDPRSLAQPTLTARAGPLPRVVRPFARRSLMVFCISLLRAEGGHRYLNLHAVNGLARGQRVVTSRPYPQACGGRAYPKGWSPGSRRSAC